MIQRDYVFNFNHVSDVIKCFINVKMEVGQVLSRKRTIPTFIKTFDHIRNVVKIKNIISLYHTL
jgi:hypothetical protein